MIGLGVMVSNEDYAWLTERARAEKTQPRQVAQRLLEEAISRERDAARPTGDAEAR